MCGSVFWGLLIILFGISVIVNAIFGINMPIFKLFFAGCLIYWGVSMLMPSQKGNCSLFFKSAMVHGDWDQEEYTVCFGQSTIDLDSLRELAVPKTVKISATFADVTVLLPRDVPVHVKANITGATVHVPGKQKNSEYLNVYGASEPVLTVLINSTFANVVVKE